MALRFLDIASIRRRLNKSGALLLTALLGAGLLACGDANENAATEASAVAETPSQQEYEQHLRDLEVQLESLERQSEAMRREVVSRLDQIDVTRKALQVQLESLRGESAAAGEAPVANAADTGAEGTESAETVAKAEDAGPSPESSSPFLRFLLLIFILAAIFFLARIFFDRWGDSEDGERPPSVEATTDLGRIRFPPGTEARPEEGDEPPTGAAEDTDEGRPGD